MATKHRLHNGVDVEQLQGMAEAIRAEPEAGIVTIRTRHRWDDGFAVDGSTEELESRRGHPEVDLRGQLELAPVRPGLGGIKATVAVRSESGDAALKALGQAVGRTSPVYDTLANPVPIVLSVIPLGGGRQP
jgi:hypothetical protein